MLIAAKDLRIIFSRPTALAQALLLGLLLIFIFSLAKAPGEVATAQEAAAIFWLCSVFCQVFIFNHLYALEETCGSRECLVLVPAPIQGIWLGKAGAGMILLLIAQIIFFPALVIFLAQGLTGSPWPGMGALLIGDAGMAALGSLLGALAQGQSGRESLLSIVLFPLLLPLLLAAISLGSIALGGTSSQDSGRWLGIGMAFDAIFIGAGMILFGFLYEGAD